MKHLHRIQYCIAIGLRLLFVLWFQKIDHERIARDGHSMLYQAAWTVS